ncbi:MAG: endo-1,4-beta-xylanase [Thermoguttaceae bacterium]|jgi:hypothetical protein
MGQISFLVTPPDRITDEVLQLAYLSGADRAPWPVRVENDGNLLTLERGVADSACLTLPWAVPRHGLLGLSTATLIERPEPYHLPLELARGTLHRLRDQVFEWQMIGLSIPKEAHDKLAESLGLFGWAVIQQEDPVESSAKAQGAIRLALDASQVLAGAYAEQVIAARRRAGGRLPSLLGAELSGPALDEASAKMFLAAFNAAMVAVSWRDIEASEGDFSWSACDEHVAWCRANGLKVCAGPLVQLDPRGLPDWVYLWEEDSDNVMAAAADFIRAAVERYRGKVDLWLCASRANTAEVLSLTEEENLRLAAGALDLVRKLDPATPTIVSVDQPWGEYLGRRTAESPPLVFADALVRAGLDVRALMLEMNLGCFRGGTLPPTELEISRRLDHWSLLGLPLLVSLSIPSGDGNDPLVERKVRIPAGTWTPETQQAWTARYVPLMLAKPSVLGVFWNQLRDSQPHDFPHAGLLGPRRAPKPALRTLAALRAACLSGGKAREAIP